VAGELEAAARAELAAGNVPGGNVPGGDATGGPVRSVRRAHLRYQGTDTSLPVPVGGLSSMMEAFEAAYRQRFSFLTRDKPVIVETVSVEVTQDADDVPGSGTGRRQ
jgi:5-oxoprolinase (ATP-hydrolysing)